MLFSFAGPHAARQVFQHHIQCIIIAMLTICPLLLWGVFRKMDLRPGFSYKDVEMNMLAVWLFHQVFGDLQFDLQQVWVPEIEFRSWGMVERTSTCWAIPMTLIALLFHNVLPGESSSFNFSVSYWTRKGTRETRFDDVDISQNHDSTPWNLLP